MRYVFVFLNMIFFGVYAMNKHEPSVQETLAFNAWRKGFYTTTLVPLSMKTNDCYMRFTQNNQCIFMKFTEEFDADFFGFIFEDYYYSFDIEKKSLNFITKKKCNEELLNCIRVESSREMKHVCEQYAAKEVSVKKDTTTQNAHFSNDYRMFACLCNQTVLVLLELEDNLHVWQMHPLNDVAFDFGN